MKPSTTFGNISLKSRFEKLKISNPVFSLNLCARKSGISKSLLQFIFRKKRHLSLDRMPALAKALKLDSTEEYFVYLMICINSSNNPEIKTHFENILNRIRHESVKVSFDEPVRSTTDDKDLYLNCLSMVLHAIASLDTFQEDASWIAQNLKLPNLSEKKIKDLLRELEEKKFLIRDASGKLNPKSQTLWRPDPYDPTGQKVFSKGAEYVAELMQQPERYRPSVYMSMSLVFDEKNLAEAEKIMIELHHRLCELSKKSSQPTSVVQFGNFMLTVCRLNDSQKKE